MKKMNPVVHFEMPAEDRKRMADFYSTVFGWEVQLLGEEMGNYALATTAKVDENGHTKIPFAINGGFYPKKNDGSDQHPSIVMAVENITESIQQINDAGGKVIGEPVEIPGIGLYVSFFDTEGNKCSVLQPQMH